MTMRAKTWALAGAMFLLGGLAAQVLPPVYGQTTQIKGPKWQYGLMVKVRRGDEPDFTKDTKKLGLDLYKDENNGNLIYVSETGSIAVVPAK
jgi:hypothetical protein